MKKSLSILCLFTFLFSKTYAISIDTIKFQQQIKEISEVKDYEKAKILLAKLDSISNLIDDKKLLVQADIQRLKVYNKFNKYSKGLSLALSLHERVKQDKKYLSCKQTIVLDEYLSEYMIAIKNYDKANDFLKKINNSSCYKRDLFNVINYKIAVNFLNSKNKKQAFKIMNAYIEELSLRKDSASLIGAYNQLGLIATYTKNYNLALKSFHKAIGIIEKTGIRYELISVLHGNIGQIYTYKNAYKKAYQFLKDDAKGSLKNHEFGSFINAEIELSKIELHWKQYEKSNKRLELLLKEFDKNILTNSRLTIYKSLAYNYNKLNKTELAFNYYDKLIALKDSLNILNKQKYESLINEYSKSIYNKTISHLKSKNELAKKDIAILKKKKQIENQRNKFLIFLLLLTILLIFFIFKRINDSKKKNAIILEKQLKLKEQDIVLEITQKKLLELQVADDRKKINSLALELNLKSDFSKVLINKIEALNKLSFPEIRSIELFIQNELDLKSSRAKIQKDIEALGNTFFDSLIKKHEKLTDSDLKLCSLVVFNLANKEIALSKNITTNSVKIAKNRLKKKLKLNSNEDLKTYLNSFL